MSHESSNSWLGEGGWERGRGGEGERGRGGGKGEGRVEEGGKEGREGKEVVIGKGNKPCLLRFRWQ